jgi:hypothetical protein
MAQYGADVNARTDADLTPVETASAYEIVRVLLDHNVERVIGGLNGHEIAL